MHTCTSGKKVYTSETTALNALVEANVQFDFTTRNGPITFYLCQHCGYYHLTSKGVLNEQLDSLIKDGSIDKMKRAAQWEAKFKKR
ncbi:MAG: hypothetical protein ACKO96_32795 [Flammeovirgaceae bacterium]